MQLLESGCKGLLLPEKNNYKKGQYMNKTSSPIALLISLSSPALLAAGFDNPSATLELRNYYLDRDYRNQQPVNQPREWAQGFIFNADSGYSQGDHGVGAEVIGVLGVKLDSGPERIKSGLLPVDASTGKAEDHYSRLHGAVKLKVSSSEFKLGGQRPNNPVLMSNNTRLLPAVFSGLTVNSKEIAGLSLEAGYLNKSYMRDSGETQRPAYYKNTNSDYRSDRAAFAGGYYQFNPDLRAGYFHMDLEDLYTQDYFGLNLGRTLESGIRLNADLRYFRSKSDGSNVLGEINNRNYNGLLSIRLVNGHTFGVGYQIIDGKGDFPFMAGTDPYVANLSLFDTFSREKTRSYQARYSYDFAGMGVPGLSLNLGYVKAGNVHAGAVQNGKYFERDTILNYVVQSGQLRNLSISLRQALLRASGGLNEDINETRVVISYPIKLL